MADYKDRNSITRPARVTGARDVITSASYWRWLVEGKVFEAGFGGEDVDGEENASGTAFDATKATFALESPVADEPIVVPILLKLMFSADGGGLSNFQVAFTKPAALCSTALALTTTTDLTSKHALYRTNPPLAAQKAKASHGDTITVSSLVAADYVSPHFAHVADEVITTGLVAPGTGPSNVQTYRFLKSGRPHLLTQGATMLVYLHTVGGDAVMACYMQWAEVTKNDLF